MSCMFLNIMLFLNVIALHVVWSGNINLIFLLCFYLFNLCFSGFILLLFICLVKFVVFICSFIFELFLFSCFFACILLLLIIYMFNL